LAMIVNPAPSPRARRSGLVLVALSLTVIAWLTLRQGHASSSPVGSHLCVVCGALAGVDIVLNTLLFIPLGLGLCLSGMRLWKAVLACCILSLSIETTQALFASGRDATLRDVLTNTVGGALGFWVARTAPIWLAPSRKKAASLTAIWAAIWLLIQIVSGYSVFPSLTPSQYFGYTAHQGGGGIGFHGDVDSARIGTISIPNGAFDDSHSIRELLLQGAPIVAVVRLTRPTPYFAPIVRVADDKQRGIASLSENGAQLIFSFRAGASNLRLREPAYAVSGVFDRSRPPADSSPTALVISARLNDGTVQLAARTPSANRELDLSPRPELAWTAVLPFQWYVENGGIERVATFLWTSVLLIPLGYWAAALVRQANGGSALAPIIVLAILAAGLIGVPAAFALKGATTLAWIAALSGVGIGAAFTLLRVWPPPSDELLADAARSH
jgi:VanZ family protein